MLYVIIVRKNIRLKVDLDIKFINADVFCFLFGLSQINLEILDRKNSSFLHFFLRYRPGTVNWSARFSYELSQLKFSIGHSTTVRGPTVANLLYLDSIPRCKFNSLNSLKSTKELGKNLILEFVVGLSLVQIIKSDEAQIKEWNESES